MIRSVDIDVLQAARDEGWAVAALSVYNLEQARAVCRAAAAERTPILLQAGSSAFAYAGLEPLAAVALACARETDAEVGIHLDHARDLDEIRRCLELGYSSVMFDGSALALEENIRMSAAVVAEAHARGAWVEAELAGLAGDEDASSEVVAAALTDPEVAADFIAQTGVDALAVSIGNVHGIPSTPVRLDLDLLARIAERCAVPLVLHGASGLDESQVLGAIDLGVAKINVNTELRRALRDGLIRPAPDRDDLPSLLGPATEAVERVSREKIRLYRRRDRA